MTGATIDGGLTGFYRGSPRPRTRTLCVFIVARGTTVRSRSGPRTVREGGVVRGTRRGPLIGLSCVLRIVSTERLSRPVRRRRCQGKEREEARSEKHVV